MVRAAENTRPAIIEALRAGRFYATGGPEIVQVEFLAPRHVRVQTGAAATILFRCNGSLGNGLHAAADGVALTDAEHVLPERARFVRIEVTDPVPGQPARACS